MKAFWNYITSIYPEAILDSWFAPNEVVFYRNKAAEDRDEPYSCVRLFDGSFTILTEF